jgi:hypothetical protein
VLRHRSPLTHRLVRWAVGPLVLSSVVVVAGVAAADEALQIDVAVTRGAASSGYTYSQPKLGNVEVAAIQPDATADYDLTVTDGNGNSTASEYGTGVTDFVLSRGGGDGIGFMHYQATVNRYSGTGSYRIQVSNTVGTTGTGSWDPNWVQVPIAAGNVVAVRMFSAVPNSDVAVTMVGSRPSSAGELIVARQPDPLTAHARGFLEVGSATYANGSAARVSFHAGPPELCLNEQCVAVYVLVLVNKSHDGAVFYRSGP